MKGVAFLREKKIMLVFNMKTQMLIVRFLFLFFF